MSDARRVRQWLEPAAVVAGLVLVVAVAPLNSEWFPVVVAVISAAAVGYAVFGAVRLEGAAEAWGFVPPPRSDLEFARGCLGAGGLAAAAFVPIVVMHFLFE